MNKWRIFVGAMIAAVVIIAGYLIFNRDAKPHATTRMTARAASPPSKEQPDEGFIHGRITTVGGTAYEGRLRWGREQEAFWDDYFNGSKRGNPWISHVPPARRPTEHVPIEIFGIEVIPLAREVDLGRQLMVRFGEIARIEGRGRSVFVTLKSGSVFELDRLSSSDFDDGVRVWDKSRGVVDLDSTEIRTIELFQALRPGAAPSRLFGTVKTRERTFTGFVQWDRQKCLDTDELEGRAAGRHHRVRFDTIRSIARRAIDSAVVTLLDGREMELSGNRDVGSDNRGIFVDDRRYGRVLIPWTVFERVDFTPSDNSGPAYRDFPAGRALTGSVTTRGGQRLAGRLIYDLDESETVEMLDAPSQGVEYSIPFGLIASIDRSAERVKVTLHSGEELTFARSGDLGERNAGVLVFVEGRERPEYVPWSDVMRIDFDPTSSRGDRPRES